MFLVLSFFSVLIMCWCSLEVVIDLLVWEELVKRGSFGVNYSVELCWCSILFFFGVLLLYWLENFE